MELKISEVLQRGIEAHKAGKLHDADKYYTAILKVQPKHTDANHNMGVLAVGVGKVEEALPFFRTALEANPSIAQFWLSYIDALIQLDRLEEAKTVLGQAKTNGATGDGFDLIGEKLNQLELGNDEISQAQNPHQDVLDALADLYAKGLLKQVLKQAQILLKKFPNSWNSFGLT